MRVIVVGCGGIGSQLIPPLLRWINSRSETPNQDTPIIFVDGDKYDEGNANRQEFVYTQIGMNKAEAQCKRYEKIYPDLNISAVEEYIGDENIGEIIKDGDIVLLGVDNHVARLKISKHCQQLNDVLYLSGSNELTDGSVFLYHKTIQPEPIEVRHPEVATTDDGDRAAMSCEELAKLPSGGQVIFTNLTAACIMLQMLYGWCEITSKDFKNKEVYFDIAQQATRGVAK